MNSNDKKHKETHTEAQLIKVLEIRDQDKMKSVQKKTSHIEIEVSETSYWQPKDERNTFKY